MDLEGHGSIADCTVCLRARNLQPKVLLLKQRQVTWKLAYSYTKWKLHIKGTDWLLSVRSLVVDKTLSWPHACNILWTRKQKGFLFISFCSCAFCWCTSERCSGMHSVSVEKNVKSSMANVLRHSVRWPGFKFLMFFFKKKSYRSLCLCLF